ncbi:MAG: substrate-binding domain-containing protein [Akkermansiaceae bacterium]|tara:strand:- start:955 stop:2121 length:1167 start_codon:yes stop_codon:yes gene_type:complete
MKERLVIRVRLPEWSTFTEAVLRGILRYQREHWRPWRLLCEGEFFGMKTSGIEMGDEECNGAILFRPVGDEAEEFKRKGLPLVVLSTENAQKGVPRVVADSVEIGRRAARYFTGLGLKDVAYIGDLGMSYSRCWQRGLVTEFGKSGGRVQIHHLAEDLIFPVEDRTRIAEILNPLLARLPKPCGIFAKDRVASNVLTLAEKAGWGIPEDFSVFGAGYSDILALTCHPPLSTIDYPSERVGYEAAATLDRMLRDMSQVPRHVIVPGSEIRERESTGVVLSFTGPVQKAVLLIRKEAPQNALQAGEVECNYATGAMSMFRREFRNQTGMSVKEMINQIRIERLELLLLETRLSIKEIRYEMAFSSTEELARFFRRAHGCSPTSYRERKEG